jgi:hypothetical protein
MNTTATATVGCAQTVGDAYVGITNLIEDQTTDHAARMARFAMAAIKVLGCINGFISLGVLCKNKAVYEGV